MTMSSYKALAVAGAEFVIELLAKDKQNIFFFLSTKKK